MFLGLATFCRNSRKDDGSDCELDSLKVKLAAQTKWQKNIYSKKSENLLTTDRFWREKTRVFREKSHLKQLDSVVFTHPQNISLSLPTDLKKLRSIGPFYLAIIELNPKQRMDVNKSDSYIGCGRKNIKRPFAMKNICEEADRFRILVQFFPVCPFRRTIQRLQPTKQ